MAAQVSAVIASRHAGTRSSLAALLDGDVDVDVLGIARDLCETIWMLRAVAPDVVLLDVRVLGDMRRLPALRGLAPRSVFLVLGMGDHPAYGAQAREAGAADYVRLDLAADRLGEAIASAISAA